MEEMKKLIKGFRGALSEHESKGILAAYDVPITKEKSVQTVEDLLQATREIGFPVVLKGCSSELSHKTEKAVGFSGAPIR